MGPSDLCPWSAGKCGVANLVPTSTPKSFSTFQKHQVSFLKVVNQTEGWSLLPSATDPAPPLLALQSRRHRRHLQRLSWTKLVHQLQRISTHWWALGLRPCPQPKLLQQLLLSYRPGERSYGSPGHCAPPGSSGVPKGVQQHLHVSSCTSTGTALERW